MVNTSHQTRLPPFTPLSFACFAISFVFVCLGLSMGASLQEILTTLTNNKTGSLCLGVAAGSRIPAKKAATVMSIVSSDAALMCIQHGEPHLDRYFLLVAYPFATRVVAAARVPELAQAMLMLMNWCVSFCVAGGHRLTVVHGARLFVVTSHLTHTVYSLCTASNHHNLHVFSSHISTPCTPFVPFMSLSRRLADDVDRASASPMGQFSRWW